MIKGCSIKNFINYKDRLRTTLHCAGLNPRCIRWYFQHSSAWLDANSWVGLYPTNLGGVIIEWCGEIDLQQHDLAKKIVNQVDLKERWH